MKLAEIEALAERIVALSPCPVVEYRLRRDVLAESPLAEPMVALRHRVERSAGVAELRAEQWPDGSWGRFHTMDSRAHARFATTERAVERALALGLDRDSLMLSRSARYMTAVLTGEATWTDWAEKGAYWPQAIRAITAGTLAAIEPAAGELDAVWSDWALVADRALAGGEHSLERERQAQRELWGVVFPRPYLHSIYVLRLLGARGHRLPGHLSRAIVESAWARSDGIGYSPADLNSPDVKRLEPWLRALEVLSAFPGWRHSAREAVEWLWQLRDADGLWDLGRGLPIGDWFPLADHWRTKGTRRLDHSTRILVLLRRYASGSSDGLE